MFALELPSMALLTCSKSANREPLYIDQHCRDLQPASHSHCNVLPCTSNDFHFDGLFKYRCRRRTRFDDCCPLPMRWSWKGLPASSHRTIFNSLCRERCSPPMLAMSGGNDAGSNSGHGGAGGNGGGHGDFSSESEDHAHYLRYGLGVMMGSDILCHDVHDDKCVEQKSVLDSLKIVVRNVLLFLFSPQAHAKASYKSARLQKDNAVDTDIGNPKPEIEIQMKERGEPDIDNVNGSDDAVYDDKNTSLCLEKLEIGKHTFLVEEDNLKHESAFNSSVSPKAVIKWFAQPVLAGNKKELAGIEKSDVISDKAEPKMDVVHASEQEAGGDSSVAKKSDIEILKRLQREAFSELMKIRERLDKIEQLVQTRLRSDQRGPARTHLKGEAKAAMAFLLLEDSSSRQSRDALARAGMQSGLNVCFTFESQFREKDTLVTQCVSGHGCSVGDSGTLGGPLTLGKLKYVKYISDDISFSFVPLGAQGKDVTEIIDVLQDQGLTSFSSQGPALFKHCRGSALGVTVSGLRFAFSIAHYLSGWGNETATTSPTARNGGDPLCLSTLGQFLLQPIEGVIVSFSGLRQYWPSPPFPSSSGLHWSEMGPLIIPKFCSLKKRQLSVPPTNSFDESPHKEFPDLVYHAESLECEGTEQLSFALGSSVELSENISVSAWAQMEKGDSFQELDKGNLQWAINIMKNSGHGIDWGASIGSCRSKFWSMPPNDNEGYLACGDGDSYSPQLQMEAFLRIDCGRGFILQPGFLYVSNKSTQIPSFIIQSKWSL